MLIEMHCHTAEHSACSRVPAVELVRAVMAKRLKGLVITDHHYLWNEADLAQLRRAAGVPPEFVILGGQETHVPVFGDVLIFGASVSIPRGTPLARIRDDFPGVAVIWAHPYRDGRIPGDELLLSPLLDAVEIFNSNHTVQEHSRALQDWRRLQFVATAGTDTHAATYAAIYPTVFVPPVTNVEDLVVRIRDGQCRPYLKERSHREAGKVTEVTIGKEKPDETREKVIVRTPAKLTDWNAAERGFHIMAAFSEHGFDKGMFRVPQPFDIDSRTRTVTEQGVTGETLFDTLVTASTEDTERYLRLAAQWLARLHGQRLRITPPEDFLDGEKRRLDRDLARFVRANHPHRTKITDLIAGVKKAEEEVVSREADFSVQGHGDYHPKNIFVARGSSSEGGSYLAVIDFERSHVMPPAFDVGWFLAQCRSQFTDHPRLVGGIVEEVFMDAYTEAAESLLPGDFWRQVELFRARTNISIAAFMLKFGLGESGELWRVLVEAERAMTYVG